MRCPAQPARRRRSSAGSAPAASRPGRPRRRCESRRASRGPAAGRSGRETQPGLTHPVRCPVGAAAGSPAVVGLVYVLAIAVAGSIGAAVGVGPSDRACVTRRWRRRRLDAARAFCSQLRIPGAGPLSRSSAAVDGAVRVKPVLGVHMTSLADRVCHQLLGLGRVPLRGLAVVQPAAARMPEWNASRPMAAPARASALP